MSVASREQLAVLGATGSIGTATLDVVARHPQRYQVYGLSAHSQVHELARLCQQTGAEVAVISDPERYQDLQRALSAAGSKARALAGPEGLLELVEQDQVTTVMAAIVGAAGLAPTLRATELGKRVLLANKESMVIAGPLFRHTLEQSSATLIPVDSEHNALFQALPSDHQDGLAQCGVEQLILTASGGPFLHASETDLEAVTPAQACKHPNWDMGRKISVDSATLMNKGLEVIEARWLFNAAPDQLDVVVHPQSIVHSLVRYRDGSLLAQLGLPDMRTPIAHALAWPERIESGVAALDLTAMEKLEFHAPDRNRFPCLALAFEAMQAGGSAAASLNAANEIAVQAFLDGEIGFTDIARVVAHTLDQAGSHGAASLGHIMAADREARTLARTVISQRIG